MKTDKKDGFSFHHVPPRCPDKVIRTIYIDDRHHRAYHLLFGNPASFEDACKILWRDWWDLYKEDMPKIRRKTKHFKK